MRSGQAPALLFKACLSLTIKLFNAHIWAALPEARVSANDNLPLCDNNASPREVPRNPGESGLTWKWRTG